MPALDWATYKARIPQAAMVADFEKQYGALQIPYPKDTVSASLDAQLASDKAAYETLVKNSNAKIENINTELAKWNAMMPVEEMTLEEAVEAVPHLVRPLVGVPSAWPHDEDYDAWKADIIANPPEEDH